MNMITAVPALPELRWDVLLATIECPGCRRWTLEIWSARTDPNSALNQASKYECTNPDCDHPIDITDPRIRE